MQTTNLRVPADSANKSTGNARPISFEEGPFFPHPVAAEVARRNNIAATSGRKGYAPVVDSKGMPLVTIYLELY